MLIATIPHAAEQTQIPVCLSCRFDLRQMPAASEHIVIVIAFAERQRIIRCAASDTVLPSAVTSLMELINTMAPHPLQPVRRLLVPGACMPPQLIAFDRPDRS